MTIRESPRPPGLFSTAMCPVCENVAIMQWSGESGTPITKGIRINKGTPTRRDRKRLKLFSHRSAQRDRDAR